MVGWVKAVEYAKEHTKPTFNQQELGKFVQLLLKQKRTPLTNSLILLVDVLLTEKLNQQEVLEKATVLGTIIILLDFGLKLLNKEGSSESELPNYESGCNMSSNVNGC